MRLVEMATGNMKRRILELNNFLCEREIKLGNYNNVEMVPIGFLDRIKEYDRDGQHALPGGESREKIEEIKEWMKRRKWKSPLLIEYDKNKRTVLLVEGNHRLVAAKELGIKALPCRVWRVQQGYGHKVKVSGYEPDDFGYVPADLKPSDVGIPTK